jgi:hypothetical protein
MKEVKLYVTSFIMKLFHFVWKTGLFSWPLNLDPEFDQDPHSS